ncbi:MAG TPA: hypothetical protein VMW36_01900 [Patescibacteria group bacterium]|nr:hypothetical protein [Patescibacteria group bacterium]
MEHLLFRERCVCGSRILKNLIVVAWSIDTSDDHNQKEEKLSPLGTVGAHVESFVGGVVEVQKSNKNDAALRIKKNGDGSITVRKTQIPSALFCIGKMRVNLALK